MIPEEYQFLKQAQSQGYAIPAFNYSDIWELLAITAAAREEHARVYVATNMRVAGSVGVDYTGAMGKQAWESTGHAAIQHLDHATTVELCKSAVDCGYQSVMIDASSCGIEENIRKVNEVVAYAHPKGVLVEAEVGRIMGKNTEGVFDGGDYLADVEEAVRLAKETHVDSLAVGIGNAHGFYKVTPHLNIRRLQEIHEALDIPLVLHGGTGIPEDQIQQCIKNGIAKINVGTLLHATYLETLRAGLAKNDFGYSLPDLFDPVVESVKQKCIGWIRVCGANHRT